MKYILGQLLISTLFFRCNAPQSEELIPESPQWQEVELSLTAVNTYTNPYTDVDVHVVFSGPDLRELRRPAFWDGGQNWKVRFASPLADGVWKWQSFASDSSDSGLHGQAGKLRSTAYTGDNKLLKHGFLQMSEGSRNVVHADGTPFVMVADTPWALPWRSTYQNTLIFAQDRMEKGFNAALLMSLQPDREAVGPDARDTEQGFAVAFNDLPEGHINQINTEYYQYLDSLMAILVNHEIVPVYQPVFHGFGWKGKEVLGWDVDAQEYARYCKYLVARYGARPAMWLVSADGTGMLEGVEEGGQIVEAWDAYQQPTGIHYNPFDDYIPDWAEEDRYVPHYNKSFQDAEWLDFQWAQTGHGAIHQYYKVERMYENIPVKAVANGEPTYEGIREPGNGAGWWQGEEAWMQLFSGGTMGVVYGAGGLWQWKVTAEEEGWPDWANSNVSWKQALELDGSRYVGYISYALEGIDWTDIEKRPDLAEGKPCLAKEGEVYLCYLPEGGSVTIQALNAGIPYRWFDPKEGTFEGEGTTQEGSQLFEITEGQPWVLIIGEKE